MGLLGMLVLLLIAVLFSSNRRAINPRTVLGALAIQVGLGAFVLFVPIGKEILTTVSDAVAGVIGFGQEGIDFLFGALVSDKMDEVFGPGQGFILAFRVLPVIIFFSSLIGVLYFLGVMQFVIRVLGGALQKLLGTSRTESMSATANIFVGQTEAPLVVRPYISRMTESELFAVMCGGLASVAGSVLAAYASLGVRMEYLIAASFMAAPGGLLFAKILVPETETPQDLEISDMPDSEQVAVANVIDAAAVGASDGLKLALNVGAMLLAFIGLIALINGVLTALGNAANIEGLTLEVILGKVFSPLAFLIGVPWSEAGMAGSFIGQKLILNEFVAYVNLAPYLNGTSQIDGQPMSETTKAIVSFALCGFANLSSIAILLGGLGSMAPSRRHDIARLGLKALLAGSLSNLMSATIAGLFLSLGGS
jgi:concentrative nucleoside transporter, CNT family